MGFASRKSVLEMGTMIPCHIQIPWKRLVGLLLNTRIAQSSCGRQDITRRSSSRPMAAGRPLRGSFVATPRSPLCFGVIFEEVMDRKPYKTPFRKNSVTKFVCPTCTKGNLKVKENSFLYQETRSSRLAHS